MDVELSAADRERFWSKVWPEPMSGCWLWGGAVSANGNGAFRLSGTTRTAHRAAFELYREPVPDGRVVGQSCGCRLCVNPDHLTLRRELSKSRVYVDGDVAYVHAGRAITKVSLDDLPLVAGKLWSVQSNGYARGYYPGARKLMHRALLPDAAMVDHKNGDKLDNRRENLRECTHGQNLANSRPRKRIHSRFKGVHPYAKRWAAYVRVDGKRVRLGAYDTEEMAAAAYDAAARLHYGEFARANDRPEIR